MSCPEITWHDALAHRFDASAAEPENWDVLRAHLTSCGDCRRDAVAIDPSLVFALRAPAPAPVSGDDAAQMIQAVASMRRAARVERRSEETRSISRLRNAPWTRWAAAAAVTTAFLSYGALEPDFRNPLGSTPRAASATLAPSPQPLEAAAARSVPVFEGLDRPDARIYDWTSEDPDVAVLMIVDENLDV